jgi:competence protein ComEC
MGPFERKARFAALFAEIPSFLIGLAALCCYALSSNLLTPLPSGLIALILLALTSGFLVFQRPLFPICLLFCLYAAAFSSQPKPLEQESRGRALFRPSSLKKGKSPFGQSYYLYQGSILAWDQSKEPLETPIEASFCWPENLAKRRPLASSDFLISGTLKSEEGHFYLKLKRPLSWQPHPERFDFLQLTERRFQAKEKLKRWLLAKTSDHEAASYLVGLFTGDLKESAISFELTRLGLKHVAVISGFHFSSLATFLSLVLSALLPRRLFPPAMIFILSAYALFVGSHPSLLRAYLSALFFWNERIVERPAEPLNLLGISLLLLLLFDPALPQKGAFQMTFLASFCLIVYLKPVEKALSLLLPSRSKEECLGLSLLEKHIHLCLFFLRKGLATTSAVHIGLIPLLLYSFHHFPLISFFVNLFYPLSIACSLSLLLLGMILSPIPFLSNGLLSLAISFTRFFLQLIAAIPPKAEGVIRFDDMPVSFPLYYTIALIAYGLYLKLPSPEDQWAV